MSLAQDLRTVLGEQYNVAFLIQQEFHDQEPVFKITPENKHEDYFMILVEFKNHNRMIMSFLPQKYSANMIRSMGHAAAEAKAQFCSFGKLLESNNAKISFSLNDFPASVTEYTEWPSEWGKVSLRVSIAPVERDENDDISYLSTLKKYVPGFVGMIISLLNIVPVEDNEKQIEEVQQQGHEEGQKKISLATRYERNPINRAICLQEYGYSCQICGINFQQRYGDIGKQFIHVHHITPVSKMGEHYVVDPLTDLIPVCPNCHAMLHRTDPPLSPQDLKAQLEACK